MRKLILFFSSNAGLGYAPFASGTVGTLAGIFIGNRLGLQVVITSAMAFKALPAIIFGGLDSVAGAIIGGFVVGILEKMAGGYIDPKFAEITP